MGETDLIYERLREAADAGALDDPILERALLEAKPNRELEALLLTAEARFRAAEAQAAAAEAHRAREARNHSQALQSLQEAHRRALRAREQQIKGLQRQQPKKRQKVRYAPGEKEALAGLGWVKRAGD